MKKIFLILSIAIVSRLFSNVSDKEIANMFMLGFYGTSSNSSSIVNDICNKGLGGVILFQKSPIDIEIAKNFTNASSLRALTDKLKSCNARPLIAIDQEGGVVQRIKFSAHYPKASTITKLGEQQAKASYSKMARELNSAGVNLNLAPVADLALNPNNKVIVKWGRSYNSSVNSVVKYSSIFIKSMHNYGIATSLKHFPGHGSSLKDTHKGCVDVTNLWQEKELEPYRKLKNLTDTVMIAHIFNRHLDANHPASLSKKTINKLRAIGFNKVTISDDMQMSAIAKYYSLKERLKLAINAGEDIILFANQVAPTRVLKIDKLVDIVRSLLNSKQISEDSIKSANIRINNLKARLYK